MNKKIIVALGICISVVMALVFTILWLSSLTYVYYNDTEPQPQPNTVTNFHIEVLHEHWNNDNETTTVHLSVQNLNHIVENGKSVGIKVYNVTLTLNYGFYYQYTETFNIGDFEPRQIKFITVNVPHSTATQIDTTAEGIPSS